MVRDEVRVLGIGLELVLHWMQLQEPSPPAQKDAAEVPCCWALHPDQHCSARHCSVASQILHSS